MKDLSRDFAGYRPLWDDVAGSVTQEARVLERIDSRATYRLGDRIKLRSELFGGIVQNRRTRGIRYLDSEAYALIKSCVSPITGDQLMARSAVNPALLHQLVSDGSIDRLDHCGKSRASDAQFYNYKCVEELPLQRPLALSLLPTLKCLRACRYCSYNSSPHVDRTPERPTEFWLKLISEAASEGLFGIHFTGGDPLQREDIAELLSAADSLGLIVTINTDLTELTDSALMQLSSLRNLDGIKVTLDGPDAKSHDRLRGKGAFRSLESNVRRLVEAGIKVDAGMVLTKDNVEAVGRTAKTCSRLGISGLHLTSLYLFGRGVALSELKPTSDDLSRAEAQYFDAILSGHIKPTETSLLLEKNRFSYSERKTPYLANVSNMISVGIFSLRVDSVGRYVLSNRLTDSELQVAGRAVDDPLAEVWTKSHALSYARKVWSATSRNKFWGVDIRKLVGA